MELPCRAMGITYVRTREGRVHLAVIIDLFSRRVVGWAISDRMKQVLALRALNMAAAIRRPPPGCIHHTERGSHDCACDHHKLLRKHPTLGGKSPVVFEQRAA